MSNGKKQKKELQSDVNELRQSAPAELISFETYFRRLMHKKPEVMLHHKAPMRSFAESSGMAEFATEEDFDRVFSRY